jgi:chromosome segregation ATPase
MESDELLKMLQDQMNEWKERKVTASPLPSLQKPVAADLMEAPPDILKELNRLRIQLAEMERKERQLTRKVVDLEQRNKTLLQEREEARKASRRLDQVENSFKKLQSAHDTLLEQMKSWQHFEQEIVAMLKRQGISLCHQDGPPEISTIVRFMDQAQVKLDTVLKDLKRRETECTHYKESNEELKAEMHGLQASVNIHSQEKKDLLGSMERLEQKIAELDGKEAIHLREAESLRALIKTFDELPLKANLGDKALSTSELSTSSKIMEVRLDALQKEIDLLTSVRDELNNKLAQETQLKRDQATELTTVKERFEKVQFISVHSRQLL